MMNVNRVSLSGKDESFVEMPGGILTISGVFYNIDSKGIEQLIPGLLAKVNLSDLLKEADAKAQSPYFLAYFGFLFGLFFSWWMALGALVIFYLLGRLSVSVLTGPIKGRFHRIITHESGSILITGLVLVYFGYYEQLLPMALGLGMFITLRLFLLLNKGGKKNTIPNKNDRILHFVLQRYALHEGLGSSLIDEMQEKILHYYNSPAQKKNGKKRS
jgi:hypothetical protein